MELSMEILMFRIF